MTRLPNIRRLRAFLKRGGVIAYATESCFGLGCDPGNPKAVAKILALKGRPQAKGLILVGGAFRQFRRYLAPVSPTLASELSRWWPGPYTLLLSASRHCPHWLKGRHAKLAVRVTAHGDAARLCNALDMALVSTSANRSGQRSLKTFHQCRQAFGHAVWVLPGRIGRRRAPSTILDPESGAVFRA